MSADTADIVSDLSGLVTSWRPRGLARAHPSGRTITSSTEGAKRYLEYAAEVELPTIAAQIQREHIEEFMAALFDRGQTASTVATRYRGTAATVPLAGREGEIDRSMTRIVHRRSPEQRVAVLDQDTLRALLCACEGRDFEACRDTAVIRLFVDTGARLAEVAGLRSIPDDDSETTSTLTPVSSDCWARAAVNASCASCASAPRASRPSMYLWLGGKGRFTGSGIAQMLRRRSRQANVPEVHPHQFRHTFAHCWLSEGGSEGDLMRLAGWKSRAMLQRSPLPPPPNAPARHTAGSPQARSL